jgi:hypothetical protein
LAADTDDAKAPSAYDFDYQPNFVLKNHQHWHFDHSPTRDGKREELPHEKAPDATTGAYANSTTNAGSTWEQFSAPALDYEAIPNDIADTQSGIGLQPYDGKQFLLWHENFVGAFATWKSKFGFPGTDFFNPNLAPMNTQVGFTNEPTYYDLTGSINGRTDPASDVPYAGKRKLTDFSSLHDIGAELVDEWHAAGHIWWGQHGDNYMNNQAISPAAPNDHFWYWHGSLDKIATDAKAHGIN